MLTGQVGEVGITGFPGRFGEPGDVGDIGEPGEDGADGLLGPLGLDGRPGKNGFTLVLMGQVCGIFSGFFLINKSPLPSGLSWRVWKVNTTVLVYMCKCYMQSLYILTN